MSDQDVPTPQPGANQPEMKSGPEQEFLPTYEEVIQDLQDQMKEKDLLISTLRIGNRKRQEAIQNLRASGAKLMERIDELGGKVPSDVEAAVEDQEGDTEEEPSKRTRKKESK